ncbi:right-handed parallel beta-helix repeat-containing protein [Candidatus Dependentiae bacterium]
MKFYLKRLKLIALFVLGFLCVPVCFNMNARTCMKLVGCQGLHNHLHSLGVSWQLILDGGDTITESGLYRLAENTNGCVVIDADNVLLDLVGATLFCDSAPVIEIKPGHKNIEIANGKIQGAADMSNDGILTGSDCSLINIKSVKIFSCDNGLNFQGLSENMIKGCKIKDCEFEECNKGVLLSYAKKMVFENCHAFNCVKAGFEQTDCKFNIFDACSALETTNGAIDERAVGFSSGDGTGNLFRECIAEGTTKTESNFCRGAIGFLLTGSEAETKIIECVANSSTVLTGSGIAFGILIEPTLLGADLADELITSYTRGSGDIASVNWFPCGDYLAIGETDAGDAARVLRFDGSLLSLIDTYTKAAPIIVSWSPCGQYLAIGGGAQISVFEFDGSSLSLLDSYDHGAIIASVDWSPSGQYLAIGGVEIGGVGGRVLRFDGSSLDLITNLSSDVGSVIFSVDWSPCGRYFAAGGVDGGGGSAVAVLEFDGKNTSALVQYSHGSGVVYSVDWSSCGKYVAMGGAGGTSGYEVRVLEFNASSPSLVPVADYDHKGFRVNSVSWSPCSKYLSMGGVSAYDPITTLTRNLRILEFDSSSLTAVAGYDHGAEVNSVDWARSGKYLAIGGGSTTGMGSTKVRIFEVMYAPENCLLKSNEVCNASGGGQQGIGICASGDNLYIKNVGFANDVNFNEAVYNVFGLCLLESGAKKFDNLWSPPYVN